MGNTSGAEAKTPRPVTRNAFNHLKATSPLAVSEIARLALWFTKTVPRGYLPRDEWMGLFLATGGETVAETTALERLWLLLKDRQYASLCRTTETLADGDDEGELIDGLEPDSDIFDWADLVVLYSISVSIERRADLRFGLLSEAGVVTLGSVVRFARALHSNQEAPEATARRFFEGTDGVLSLPEFARVTEAKRMPEIDSCFGFLAILANHLVDAAACLSAGGAASGVLSKRSSSFAWSPRYVSVDGGFLWYRSEETGPVKQVIFLEGASVERVRHEEEEEEDEEGSSRG
jgi:hypothetical protein